MLWARERYESSGLTILMLTLTIADYARPFIGISAKNRSQNLSAFHKTLIKPKVYTYVDY